MLIPEYRHTPEPWQPFFMRPSFSVLMPLSLTFFSCMTNDKKQEPKPGTLVASVVKTPKLDSINTRTFPEAFPLSADTLTIDRKAAVFYQPDSLQIEKRIKQVGEADFRMGMDDYIFRVNISVEYLQKQGLPVLDAKNRKYLKFVSADKKFQLIKLDTLQELWGMYLFDPDKKPHYADITGIEEDYKTYYSR